MTLKEEILAAIQGPSREEILHIYKVAVICFSFKQRCRYAIECLALRCNRFVNLTSLLDIAKAFDTVWHKGIALN